MATQTKDNSVIASIVLANVEIPSTVKNLTIGDPSQPGKVYFKDEAGDPTMEDSVVTAKGIKLELSDTGSFSESLVAGASDTISATLTNEDGHRLFASAHVTLYEGSASASNTIPDGASVNPNNWQFSMWPDWGDSDNDNFVFKTFVKNVSATTRTVVFEINFRYIVEEAGF